MIASCWQPYLVFVFFLAFVGVIEPRTLFKRGECIPNPCQNGAQCMDVGPYYVCNCVQGYHGKYCEIAVCAPNPCQNKGVCQPNKSGNFACECADGFTGERCEESVCQPNPCENGGSCSSLPQGNHLCVCPDGYQGNNCEVNMKRST